MPNNIWCIQPGGGAIVSLELAWGRARRLWLKTFRPGYVARMRSRLEGDPASCPVEVIDSRDLKFFRNVARCRFPEDTDPHAWRGRLPFARAGFAELLLFGGSATLVALLFLTGWFGPRWLAAAPVALAAFVVSFFRDPQRAIPADPDVVVSPADGKVVDLSLVDDPGLLGEPALRIGIFLSVFNVHVNRAPLSGRLVRLRYQPGKFLNALKARSVEENERMELTFIETGPAARPFIVRQIAGAIARRIVCELGTGDQVRTGDRFGMIKFGSRTELLLPARDLEVLARVGDHVRGGASPLARYKSAQPGENGRRA